MLVLLVCCWQSFVLACELVGHFFAGVLARRWSNIRRFSLASIFAVVQIFVGTLSHPGSNALHRSATSGDRLAGYSSTCQRFRHSWSKQSLPWQFTHVLHCRSLLLCFVFSLALAPFLNCFCVFLSASSLPNLLACLSLCCSFNCPAC